MDEFLLELDEDVEGMQSTIYLLQQQLKEAKEQISQLQEENVRLGGHQADSMIADANTKAGTYFQKIDAHTQCIRHSRGE